MCELWVCSNEMRKKKTTPCFPFNNEINKNNKNMSEHWIAGGFRGVMVEGEKIYSFLIHLLSRLSTWPPATWTACHRFVMLIRVRCSHRMQYCTMARYRAITVNVISKGFNKNLIKVNFNNDNWAMRIPANGAQNKYWEKLWPAGVGGIELNTLTFTQILLFAFLVSSNKKIQLFLQTKNSVFSCWNEYLMKFIDTHGTYISFWIYFPLDFPRHFPRSISLYTFFISGSWICI